MFFPDKSFKYALLCKIFLQASIPCSSSFYVRRFCRIRILPDCLISCHAAGSSKIIGFYRPAFIQHNLAFRLLYCLICTFLAFHLIINLKRNTVIHMRLIFRICIFLHLPDCIRAGTDCLGLQCLFRITGWHLAWYNSPKIFFQRNLIDDDPAILCFIILHCSRIFSIWFFCFMIDSAAFVQNQYPDAGICRWNLRKCFLLLRNSRLRQDQFLAISGWRFFRIMSSVLYQ